MSPLNFMFLVAGIFINSGFSQIFEGSVNGTDEIEAERFIDFSNDPPLSVDAQEYGECVPQNIPGLSFNMKGKAFTEMFICPNGFVSFTDPNMQNWPFTIGTLSTQRSASFFAPYWSRVDLPSFASGNSRVHYRGYHKDFTEETDVFDKVNQDVRTFKGDDSFEATWVSVITWKNVEPFDAGNFGGKNTFQAVMVSNETSWYLIYNYGDMDWAVRAPRAEYDRYDSVSGLPVMGWNTGQDGFDYLPNQQYENLPNSGTVNAELIDDVRGNLGTGRWIFDVGGSAVVSPDLECFQWYEVKRTEPRNANQRLSCPPIDGLALLDRRFQRELATETSERVCFVNVLPRRGRAIRCCYGKGLGGSLIRNPPLAGSVLTKNPLYSETDDIYGHTKCCIESNRCRAYYSLLPIETGERYSPPRWAWGFGDPHYENMDRMNYTFNGCGKYMFLDTVNSAIQIQVKFSQAIGAGLGTVISAVLLRFEGVADIQINLILQGGILFLHNGTEYADASNFGASARLIEEKVSVVKPDERLLILTTEDGTGILVRDEKSHLVVTIVLEQGLFGKTRGLLGNWSGSTDDDWLLPNGTILTPPLTDEQIHYDFGEKWVLTGADDKFVNTTADIGFSCSSDYKPIFVNNFTFPNGTFESLALSTCGGSTECLFDIAATLSPEFGQITLNNSDTIERNNEVIENLAPVFTVEAVVFNMTMNQQFQYTISATDPNGDSIAIRAVGLPAGATQTQSGNSLTFTWTPDNTTRSFEVSFIATDTKNASTSLTPTINMCACQNGGTCFKSQNSDINTLTVERYDVLECRCAIGYEGDLCQTVKDFCITESGSPCHPQVNCTNSPTGYICGPCPTGFGGDGQNCSDINECDRNTDNCEMLCVNNAGSFECQCNSGYQLNPDNRNCDDIDECSTGHECMHTCTNTEGSYNCSCLENFEVDPNNHRNCQPKTPCTGSHSCQQVCFIDESTNAETCSCNIGYRLQTDGLRCADIDECAEDTDRCSQTCTNTQGSYTCGCADGYRMIDAISCEDINECIEDPGSCDSSIGEKCFNLPGGFKCDCNDNQGLVRINGTCQVPTDSTGTVTEPAPTPPDATQAQINNAVQFRISDFQSSAYVKQTDSTFRQALAKALTAYCNANTERRTECGLPGNGFTFTELNIHRIPNDPKDDGDDALVSFYALYPNGTQNEDGNPVPLAALLNAWNEQLRTIRNDTNLQLSVTTEAQTESSSTPDDLDWPLVLGVSIAGVLLLVLGICVLVLACSKRHTGGFPPQHDYYERRRWSFGEPPSQYSVTGESHPGFDEDGLPVEVGTNYGSGTYGVQGGQGSAYYNY